MANRDVTTPKHEFPALVFLSHANFKERNMKVKINEDWLATFIAFALLILAMINVIKPEWAKF